MSRLSCFFSRVQTVICAVLLGFFFAPALFAQGLPDESLLSYEAQHISVDQEKAQQLLYMERCAEAKSRLTRNVLTAVLLMFLFGAFSALWAQNTGRNACQWFFYGFALNLGAVLLILWLNPRKKRRKKGSLRRVVKDYWTLVHP